MDHIENKCDLLQAVDNDPVDIHAHKLVLSLLEKLGQRSSVLDIGTGTGLIAKFIAEHGHNVLGIDVHVIPIDDEGKGIGGVALPIDTYRAIAVPLDGENGTLHLMSTDVFDFVPSTRFDVVTALAFLHYVKDIMELEALADRIVNWLNPNGYVALSWICGEDGITRSVNAYFPRSSEVEAILATREFAEIFSEKVRVTHSHGENLSSPGESAVEHSHSFRFSLWQRKV